MSDEMQKTKLIVTLGPATRSEEDLRAVKARGVDFVRINMSHSSIDDLRYFIALAKKVGIPFIIDTEGSQMRTGDLERDTITIEENAEVKLYAHPIIGNEREINLRPKEVVSQLERGDILHVDFDSLILRVSDTSTIAQGFITAKSVSGGVLGNNKAVVVDPGTPKTFVLPPFSEKDYESIQIGLDEGIKHIAASYMQSGVSVDEVREATGGRMKIISKVECQEALDSLDDIIAKSDFLLLDRGDLSKEIPIEKIPLTQKTVIAAANRAGRGVFVATNLLESMVTRKKPTRAEVVDVVNAVLDGAYGLMLSSETAIGKYPIACVNMLNKLIAEARGQSHSGLVPPHGGTLVDRVMREQPDEAYLGSLPKITLDQERQMDVEQIAIGTFSPLLGFMGKADFESVLDNMRLASGEVWTIPIILDVSEEVAQGLFEGSDVALCDDEGPMAILHLEEKYAFDKDETNQKLYNTTSIEHPGVRWIHSLNSVLLGGKISLIRRRKSEHKEYELTPRQVRRMFHERGWSKVVGFHTRNVIHRSHEFIQLEAMSRANADGLFVHPVIGKKKPGDFHARYIIAAYEQMVKRFYPRDKVVFATYATFSRYAGPREAIFTALCRKNFGCSHFVVGRDHTGVGDFYHPKASHEIFSRFPDLGIEPVFFDNVFYSNKLQRHVHERDDSEHGEEEKMHISGTQARKMFEQGERPPEWFMRLEISEMILSSVLAGEEVFVPEDVAQKRGAVLWFTGLSGSGKSTIAWELARALEAQGKRVTILDGDTIREQFRVRLGFSREDIRENNRRIAILAKEEASRFDVVLVPIISPYAEDRAMARSIVGGRFVEVFISAPLEACMARDAKGLYARAQRGEMDNLIGFSPSHPYEAPSNPDVAVKTDELTPTESARMLADFLNQRTVYAKVPA
ncbi:MAG: sulfate adenylyltransferase [Parcubacteria group bacterium]|nr:sulfate adenylyltransferase [Parcubacteria group bacterium]